MKYSHESLLIRPDASCGASGCLLSIVPEAAGWEYISFQARRLAAGDSWSFATGENELALVNFTGVYRVESNRGAWDFGGRPHPFAGAAHVLYLPRGTSFTVTAVTGGEFAATWAPALDDFPARLIAPEDVPKNLRGGDNAMRQIHDLLPPGSPVSRLVLVEVYTPGGNWSSYPPHKHDVHAVDASGTLIEADLEEVYFYKFDRPEGYAFQRVYTGETSPLQCAGAGFDATVMPEENCAVLVPEGYHPVTSPPGYCTYYLNVLAGSAQSLANRDDPRYSWVKDSYTRTDPRLPLF